jgi:hypothetical protein
MREITTKVYTFDELSDAAKEKAREWFRQDIFTDPTDWASVFADTKEIASLFGLDIQNIYFTGFASQGDGACFAGNYSYKPGELKAVKAHAPHATGLHKIVEALHSIQRRNFYQITATTSHTGHHYNSWYMSVYSERKDGKDWAYDARDEITEQLRNFANWIYCQLEAEYDYQMWDEAIDKTIQASGCEFTEEGKRA